MEKNSEKLRDVVKQAYGSIARQDSAGNGCCGPSNACSPDQLAGSIGYSLEELGAAPEGANLGLGCGNPTAIAALQPGEIVLDLGAGAGFDCFLAAEKVGPRGMVIGVDMTTDMIARAEANCAKTGFANVEFMLGEIEKLPVADASVDVVISNCVINLSPDKESVFREISRVLKPGGRVAVSDIVLLRELPYEIRQNIVAWTGCVSGAVTVDQYRSLMEKAGLQDITVTIKDMASLIEQAANDPMFKTAIEATGGSWRDDPPIASAYLEACK